jgi:UDP-glucose 4-epimerase
MEVYASLAYKLYRLPSIGLRFFNVYGPRQDPNSPYSGVISIFVKNIQYGQATTINGGHQTRDFVYVGDVVDALEGSIKHLINSRTCDVANILSGTSTSIDVLFEVLCRILNKTSSVERKPLGLGDALKSEGTVDKMNSIFPKLAKTLTSLEVGLKKTIREPDYDK